MTPELVVFLVCVALLVQLAIDHLRLAGAVRARRLRPLADPPRLPFLSVVRPTKGEDVEQLDNFRAALATDYRGPLETIFVFEDAADPGYRHALQAIAEHEASGAHGTARIVLAGAPPAGRTGKISNMIAGVASSGGGLIAFGDSDSRPHPSLFPSLVRALLADPGAGVIFAPPVATPRARTAGDVGYAIILNAYLGAAMRAFAGADRSLPFLMGQCMLFRRDVLDAIGGIECADGQLVDDMFLGAQVVQAGYRNLLADEDIAVINHSLSFAAFWRLWRRWLFFGRGGIPLVGGAAIPLRLLWMVWLPQSMVLAIAVSMLLKPEVEWRGHVYRLDLAARLRRD